ncbi:hypothetical protein Dsin_028529 [Dipteronia sinensis]|uniref:Reverse transcriptase zinc-binding domain-containing protein n=1 Tax=Dipteronia sinensis TaxID=43782 RepID=A0AAD9ZQK8_9ROSI|nr:hypothetical protein Dsin_028529 [Dipteronia sinensis]
MLHKKCYGGNLAVKIDIRKAFDTLDWASSIECFRRLGFLQFFVGWIDGILGSSWLLVSINGAPEGFTALTHLLYVDDVLIFCRGTMKNVRGIMRAFEIYSSISGQMVNWSKSSIFFGSSIFHSRIGNLQALESKLVRVSWGRCCRPYSHGGLGLKDLGLLNDLLLKKFTWKFITSDEFAFSFLGECYLRQLQRPHDEIAISLVVDSPALTHSRDGRVLCKTAYSRLIRCSPLVSWWRDVWSRFIPHFRSALTWHLFLNQLPVEDRWCMAGFLLASQCSICGVSSDSTDHLLLQFPLTVAL